MGVQPGNPVVGGVMLRIPAIRSPNFIRGVAGWTIDIDGSAEFNNVTIRGDLIGKNYVINSDGAFFYTGTPAAGNLAISLANSAGTDAYGNSYPAGITSGLAGTGQTNVNLAGDILLSGADGSNVIRLNANQQRILVYNDPAGAGQLAMSIALTAGTDAYGNSYPAGVNITAAVHTMPGMSHGWSVGGHAKYALDALGNLIVSWGVLNVGTSTDTTEIWGAGSLPAAFRPATPRRMACYSDSLRINGDGTTEAASLEIETDGSVQCYGFSLAATRADLFAIVPLMF